jgi:hypothetical protein
VTVTPGPPSVTPAALDPLVVMRLYDETKEMRSDVTGMRSDLRDLATVLKTGLSQIGDHESRIRALEQQAAQAVDHEPRLTGLERRVWAASGVAAVISSGAAAWITELVTRH